MCVYPKSGGWNSVVVVGCCMRYYLLLFCFAYCVKNIYIKQLVSCFELFYLLSYMSRLQLTIRYEFCSLVTVVWWLSLFTSRRLESCLIGTNTTSPIFIYIEIVMAIDIKRRWQWSGWWYFCSPSSLFIHHILFTSNIKIISQVFHKIYAEHTKHT